MEAFHLPAGTQVGQVHLQIPDLKRALSFYADLLGFKIVDNGGGKVVLSASGQKPGHIVLTELPNVRPRPPRTTSLFHLAIRFPNRVSLAQVLQRLITQRYPLQGFADHAVSEAIYLADPDGNGVELYTDRPRNEWPIKNDRVEMVTETLDVESLLEEISDTDKSWDGIDAGTDIGHVHLRVSDLAKARRFYHEILGLDITQENYSGALFLAAGGYHHHLGLNIWGGRNIPSPPGDAVGLQSFSLEIPDGNTLNTLRTRITEAGSKIESTVEKEGAISELSARDPDGNLVLLRFKEIEEITS